MKIVISAAFPDISMEVDPRLDCAEYLIVVDTQTMEWQAHPNPAVNAAGGSDVQAAEWIIAQKANAVISSHYGKTTDMFKKAGIEVYAFRSRRPVQEAAERFKLEQLQRLA